jgi:hypothetical protein
MRAMRPRAVDAIFDVALAVFLLVVAVTFFTASLGLQKSAFESVGPAAVPQAVCVLIAALAAILLFHAIRRLRTAEALPNRAPTVKPEPVLAILIFLVTAGYIALMNTGLLGFRSATIAYILMVGSMLGRFQPRRLPVLLLISLILGFGLHYLFTQVFVTNLR